ncbi:hypothetical protein SVIO_067260 [Streptomyces violaceusniger]|uniref:Beta-lactamase class A catalytic domain-containing protein n=1 Tax=Streptomyces violaceusniger TaxID=68280 RepID=A0A4D4LDE0_STRVO|nr:hypothetical protein SVIO_067260 [Streptomyces violaceusniger]
MVGHPLDTTLIEKRIAEVFAEADAEGRLHAVDIDAPGHEIGLGVDDQVVIASVFKILLVLELARQADAGQLDPRERVVITAPTASAAGAPRAAPTMSRCPCATWRTSRCR